MTTNTTKSNIPEGWKTATIEEVCENLDNLRKPVTRSDREKGDIPYYGATGVVDYVQEYIYNEPLLLLGEDGADWSKFANTAYLVDGPSWVNNHAHVLRCIKINRYFLKEYLNYNDLNQFITGGTRGKLTKGILSKITVALPPENEQNKIAGILSSVDAEVCQIEKLISTTEKLKSGLMQRFFSQGTPIKLGEVANIVRGGSPRPIENFITNKDDGLNWLRIGDIEIGSKYITHTSQKIDKSGLNKTTLVKPGDFILSNSMSFGRPYIMKVEACIHDGWLAFKEIKSNLANAEFLYYLLSSPTLQNKFKSVAAGSGVKNLKKESVAGIEANLPSISEQQRIADILSSADQKVYINKQIKEKLTQLKRGLMQDLLSGLRRV